MMKGINRLRVAQVTNLMESVPPLYQHGLEQLVYYLTEELVRQGVEVTLYATGDSKTSAKLVPVWPGATMRHPRVANMTAETYEVWSVSEAMAHAGDYDVIHDHTRFISGHFAGVVQTPVVTTIHHPIDFEKQLELAVPVEYRQFYKEFWARHQAKSHIVVVSEFQAGEFEKMYGYPPTVIHNGIDIKGIRYQETENRDYLAFLGYVTPNKGVAEAIQAVLPTVEKLIIAGPLDETEENQNYFNNKVKPYIDGNKIKFIGPVAGQDKWDLLAGAKATLMPIQWDEPFGLVAVESLAVGTPVIATCRGALPEILVNGVSGFVVDSVEEMSQRIKDLNQIDRGDCRKRVEEEFTAKKMTEKYIELYRSLGK